MTWGSAIDDWATWLRAAGRPETTIGLRTYHLTRLAREAPAGPWDLTDDDLVAWFGTRQWSAETRRSMRSSLRSFYGWAVKTGRTSHDTAAVLASIRRTPPNPRPAPEAMIAAALQTAPPRVRLMVALAAGLGLRRGEVARVHARDIIDSPWGASLTVHGKGAKVRIVPLTDSLAAQLRHATATGGYAFPSSPDAPNPHLSPEYVGKLVSRVLPPGWTMHTLRHRFATSAYAVDTDIITVMQLLGHASPETTLRYVLTPDDALRRTVAAIA